MIPKYIEILPLLIEYLKKDILSEFRLSWAEYHLLCLINQFDLQDKIPTAKELIETSGKNLGRIYRSLRKLKEEGYISFSEGKFLKYGKTLIAPLGVYSLKQINSKLARMVRGIQKDIHSLTSEEDCV